MSGFQLSPCQKVINREMCDASYSMLSRKHTFANFSPSPALRTISQKQHFSYQLVARTDPLSILQLLSEWQTQGPSLVLCQTCSRAQSIPRTREQARILAYERLGRVRDRARMKSCLGIESRHYQIENGGSVWVWTRLRIQRRNRRGSGENANSRARIRE